jgi:hypothetical protein
MPNSTKNKDQSIFRRQSCSVCKCDDKFNFDVPDAIWREVVPAEFRNTVVCLQCFDELARNRNIDYSDSIETLYFAGKQASFKFQTVAAQSA